MFRQSAYRIRFDWGLAGLRACAPGADAVVIVDVLSFCTAVDVACSRGAEVLPYRGPDDGAADFAAEHGAVLAGRRGRSGYTLSPVSLRAIPAGTRLVLPSPNGSALSVLAAELGVTRVYAGCLRNAGAVAEVVQDAGTVAVIAAGEHWPDGALRPAAEDLAGAAAILAGLDGVGCSPEVAVAVAASQAGAPLTETISGRELAGAGFVLDVVIAAESKVSRTVPVLVDGERYVAQR